MFVMRLSKKRIKENELNIINKQKPEPLQRKELTDMD